MTRWSNAPLWLGSLIFAYAVYLSSLRAVRTTLRGFGALLVSGATYFMVLFLIAAFWHPASSHGARIYAAGMAVGTLGAGWAASRNFPARHRELGVLICTALAALFPVVIAAISGPDAPARALTGFYIAATVIGGGCAMALLPRRTAMAIYVR